MNHVQPINQTITPNNSNKGEPPELTANDVFGGGDTRAFPNAVDGTPQDYTSKTAADEQAKAAIEKPMTHKLRMGNLGQIIQQCRDGIETITDYEKDRQAINSEIQAIRENLESLGIGKKPLAMAIGYSKLNTKQREGFDLAYSILRQAIGDSIKQVDMFYDAPITENTTDNCPGAA